MKSLIPTSVVTPFGTDAGVTVYAFGKMPHEAMAGWKFGRDGVQNTAVEKRIAEFAFERGVVKIFAPIPDFCGQVCFSEQLSLHASYQVGRCERVSIYRDTLSSDGLLTQKGTAFYIAPADCLTFLLYNPDSGKLVSAHAGRESLYDPGVLVGKPVRRHGSLVGSAIEAIGGQVERLRAFAGFGISRDSFQHPWPDPISTDSEKRNLAMCKHLAQWDSKAAFDRAGRISIKKIIREQLVAAGVADDAIAQDCVDTFSDQTSDGSYRWWSNRRGDKEERNGVLVVYNPSLIAE